MRRRDFLHTAATSAAAWAATPMWSRAGSKQPAVPQPSFPDRGAAPDSSGGWSLAVIPDTQNYTKYGKNQRHFHGMTRWLKEHAEAWNLMAVLHEGDIVEQNDIAEGGGRGKGDQCSEAQWQAARKAMATLHGVVPTLYTTGNHDYGLRNAENRRTQFNGYFGLTDNPLVCDGRGGGVWRESGPNSYGAKTLENAAYEIAAPDGRKLLILALEWGPRREAVDWGRQVLAKAAYQDHLGILLTHNFLTPSSTRSADDKSSANPHHSPTGRDGNTHDGEELWQALVKPSAQIQMTLNGHEVGRHVGYRQDPGDHGRQIHQMLFNAQNLGGGSGIEGNGGNGWLRLLTFEADGTTVSVRTFSPLLLELGKDPWNRDPAWSFTLQLG